MNKPAILSPFWEQASKDKKKLLFSPLPTDSTHILVCRTPEEGSEVIGHVYVEFEGDDFKYICTNGKGKEIFPSTTDFNLVETRFERYAQLFALHKWARLGLKRNKILNHNNSKNTINMKTQSQNKTQETKKENQMLFIEYEKPTKDGHFITVGDKYKNTIARIHKSYNPETKKYEYVAFDHTGSLMMKSEKLWELKNEFIKNSKELLEQAHQKRIASKQQSKEVAADKSNERKAELQKLREDDNGKGMQNEKTVDEAVEKQDYAQQSQEEEREQELQDIRDSHDDDRGDMER